MSVLVRITDFVPSTLIKSQEVDDELNQLVNLLSGVSTTKDTLLKFSDGSNPVLRVDQLGAGVIQQWLQNGAVKTVIDNSGFLYIGEGITDATPANGLINATGGSGSNITGANLDIAGGKGTGNAEPGLVCARYPLRGASGSTLQSLSSNRYPFESVLFTNTNAGTALANSTTETSLFTGMPATSGSTRSIEAGISKQGTVYVFRAEGTFGTTGTPNLQFRLKFGSTTIVDSTVFATPNNSNGVWQLEIYIFVYAIGATGQVRCQMYGDISGAAAGLVTPAFFRGANQPTVDFTSSQTVDLTGQWGTASASNTITMTGATIERKGF